jgi:hypothetical protein
MLARTEIRKILVSSLVALLLCGIVASEFPELLSLTDNTANDFTLRKTNTEGLRALPDAVRVAINFSVPAATLLHSRLVLFEKAAPPSDFSFFTPSPLQDSVTDSYE